jgi:hypothetical protein
MAGQPVLDALDVKTPLVTSNSPLDGQTLLGLTLGGRRLESDKSRPARLFELRQDLALTLSAE